MNPLTHRPQRCHKRRQRKTKQAKRRRHVLNTDNKCKHWEACTEERHVSTFAGSVLYPRNVCMLGMDCDTLPSLFFCRYACLIICSRLNSETPVFVDAWRYRARVSQNLGRPAATPPGRRRARACVPPVGCGWESGERREHFFVNLDGGQALVSARKKNDSHRLLFTPDSTTNWPCARRFCRDVNDDDDALSSSDQGCGISTPIRLLYGVRAARGCANRQAGQSMDFSSSDGLGCPGVFLKMIRYQILKSAAHSELELMRRR